MCQSLFFEKKSCSLRYATLIKKEILALVFWCEFCENFKNTYFAEHHRTTASGEQRMHPELQNMKS